MNSNAAEQHHPTNLHHDPAVFLRTAATFAVRFQVSQENGVAQKISDDINEAINTAVGNGELPRKFAKHCNAVAPQQLGVTIVDRSLLDREVQLAKLSGVERGERVNAIHQLAVMLQRLLAQREDEVFFEPGKFETFGPGKIKSRLGVVQQGWHRHYSRYPDMQFSEEGSDWSRTPASVLQEVKTTCIKAITNELPLAEEFALASFQSKPHLQLVKNPRGFRAHDMSKLVPVISRVLPRRIRLQSAVVVPGNADLRQTLKAGNETKIPQESNDMLCDQLEISYEVDTSQQDVMEAVWLNMARRKAMALEEPA